MTKKKKKEEEEDDPEATLLEELSMLIYENVRSDMKRNENRVRTHRKRLHRYL